MTAVRMLHINCDGPHKPGCVWYEQFDQEKLKDARRVLRKLGWVYRDGDDLCPACK